MTSNLNLSLFTQLAIFRFTTIFFFEEREEQQKHAVEIDYFQMSHFSYNYEIFQQIDSNSHSKVKQEERRFK